MPHETANHQPARDDSVRQVVRALFAYRFTALGFFALFFGFLLLIGYWFPPLYLGRALILVKPGRELLPQSIVPITMAPTGNVPATIETVNSEVAILTSRPVLEAVVDRLLAEQEKKADNFITRFQDWCRKVGLLPDLPQRENLILGLGDKIEPEQLPMSNVIEVEFLSFNAEAAWKTVDYLVDAYLAQRTKIHSNPTALAFFEKEAAREKAALDAIDAKLTQFRADNDGGDLTLQRTLLLQELTTTESKRRALDQIPEGSEEVASAVVGDNPTVAMSRQRLLDLRLQLATLAQQYGDGARETQGVHAQIVITTADLRQQLVRLHDVLADSETRVREALRAAEQKRGVYDALTHEQARLVASFELYRQKAEEERLYQEMDAGHMANVRVLERPTPPQKPWFPNAFVLALLGLVLGVPGAIAAALLRAWLGGRVATVHDVEKRLEVPVLASVRRPRLWHGARRRAADMADAARLVHASLGRRKAELPDLRVVHVAAASHHEGADAFAAALARVAGEQGLDVALVALGHVPSRRREGAPPDAAALLARGRPVAGARGVVLHDWSDAPLDSVPDAIATLRAERSLVVVAGKPLCGRGDGARFLVHADVTVLVIGAGRVHFDVARRAAGIAQREARMLAGAVLTHRDDPVPGLLYRWI